MKKYLYVLVILMFMLCGCSQSKGNESNEKNESNQNQTVNYLPIYTKDDFNKNFSFRFVGKTSYDSKNKQYLIGIEFTKKSNFLLLNAFKLHLEVYRWLDLNSGSVKWTYIDSTIGVSETYFNRTLICTLSCPVKTDFAGDFNTCYIKYDVLAA